MEVDTSVKYNHGKEQLCTHHVGSGRKEERGILGSVNTARLARDDVTSCTPIWSQILNAQFSVVALSEHLPD